MPVITKREILFFDNRFFSEQSLDFFGIPKNMHFSCFFFMMPSTVSVRWS